MNPPQKSSQHLSLPRIPINKPHFRYAADYDRISKAQLIKVKFWKLHSFRLVNFYQEPDKSQGFDQIQKSHKKFQDTLNTSTIKKCLKHVKKITILQREILKRQSFLQFCSTLKLNRLHLSMTSEIEPFKTLKRFMNSKLRYCVLSYPFSYQTEHLDPQTASLFRRMRKCRLFVTSFFHKVQMLINTDQLRSWTRSFSSQLTHILPNIPDCLEKISYEFREKSYTKLEVITSLPPLPNLKELHLKFDGSLQQKKPIDLSFIAQYSNLESLKIHLISAEASNWDSLSKLSGLKEFDFTSQKYFSFQKQPVGSLPNFTMLEKIRLSMEDPFVFGIGDIRDLLQRSKNLQSLELNLSIQNINSILRELVLPHIEKLKLSPFFVNRSTSDEAKKLAEILRAHDSIKEFELDFETCQGDLNAILFKEGLPEMRSLESFTLNYRWPQRGEPQGNNFIYLQGIFTNLKNLRSLNLMICKDTLGPQEFTSILDGLSKLKSLEKFGFAAKFAPLTSADSMKFHEFLVSLRYLKVLDLRLHGISEKETNRLKQALLPKFALSQEKFYFQP